MRVKTLDEKHKFPKKTNILNPSGTYGLMQRLKREQMVLYWDTSSKYPYIRNYFFGRGKSHTAVGHAWVTLNCVNKLFFQEEVLINHVCKDLTPPVFEDGKRWRR